MRAPLMMWLGFAAEVAVVAPSGPNDACQLVGESDGGFVVTAPFLNVERPGTQSIE